MASYSIQAVGEAPYPKNRTLSGTTADAVTILGADPSDQVEVRNRSASNEIGVNPNGATAVKSETSTSDGTVYVGAGGTVTFYIGAIIQTAGADVLSIVGNGDAYSVTILPKGSIDT